MKNRFAVGMMVVVFTALIGCGGGTSGSTTSSGDDDSSSVTSIDSLGDIPSGVLDPQAYDLTTASASASIAASKSASVTKVDGQQEGSFSRAGCEMNRMKKNIIRSAKMPQMILCHMQQMETAAGGNAAGDGEFNYWKMDEDLGENKPQGLEEFSPRMAIKKDGEVLTFVMCNGTEKQMEMVIGTANGVYEGHVVDNFGGMHQFQMNFSADGPPESFTVASFSNTFAEASQFWTGYGQERLDATPTKNTVSGFYSEVMDGTEFAGATYGVFDATQGTARYRQDSGEYPAETVQMMFQHCETMQGQGNCGDMNNDWINGWLSTECSLSVTANSGLCFNICEEGQPCCPVVADGATCEVDAGEGPAESFTIDTTDPYNLMFNVALTSDYEAEVLAAALPDSSAEPVISFTDASAEVDCSQSDSWDPIPFVAEPDLTACQELENEMSQWDTGELCSIQDQAANGGEQMQ